MTAGESDEGSPRQGGPLPGLRDHPPLPFDEHLEALSTTECAEYLADGGLGRVAVVIAGIPVILPVSFIQDGDDIVFLTGSGAKLRAALVGQAVAFETDNLDDDRRGWSVLVIGEASASDDPADIARARELGLEPAAPGPHEHMIRIARRIISGRRFGWPGSARMHPRQP